MRKSPIIPLLVASSLPSLKEPRLRVPRPSCRANQASGSPALLCFSLLCFAYCKNAIAHYSNYGRVCTFIVSIIIISTYYQSIPEPFLGSYVSPSHHLSTQLTACLLASTVRSRLESTTYAACTKSDSKREKTQTVAIQLVRQIRYLQRGNTRYLDFPLA